MQKIIYISLVLTSFILTDRAKALPIFGVKVCEYHCYMGNDGDVEEFNTRRVISKLRSCAFSFSTGGGADTHLGVTCFLDLVVEGGNGAESYLDQNHDLIFKDTMNQVSCGSNLDPALFDNLVDLEGYAPSCQYSYDSAAQVLRVEESSSGVTVEIPYLP
jgi:hypothetical protein